MNEARHLELGPNAIDYAIADAILARWPAASRVPSAVEQMKVTAVREAVSSLLGYVYDHWPLFKNNKGAHAKMHEVLRCAGCVEIRGPRVPSRSPAAQPTQIFSR